MPENLLYLFFWPQIAIVRIGTTYVIGSLCWRRDGVVMV